MNKIRNASPKRKEKEEENILTKSLYEHATVVNNVNKTLELVGIVAKVPLYNRDGVNIYELQGPPCNIRERDRTLKIMDKEIVNLKLVGIYNGETMDNVDQLMSNLVSKVLNTTRMYKYKLIMMCNHKMLIPERTYRQNGIKNGDTITIIENIQEKAMAKLTKTEEDQIIKKARARSDKQEDPEYSTGGPYQYLIMRFPTNDAYLLGLVESSGNMYIGFKENPKTKK